MNSLKRRSRRVVLFSRDFPAISQTFLALRFRLLVEREWDVHVLCERSGPDARRAFPDIRDFYDRVHVVASRDDMIAALGRCDPGVLHFEFGHDALDYLDVVPDHPWSLLVSFQGYDICIRGLDREPGYYAPIWRRADAINFDSEDLRSKARARGMPPSMQTVVIPPLADLDLFEPERREHTDRTGSAQRPLRLLFVGRLHWKKGVGYGLRAVREVLDSGLHCELRIVGDGPAKTELMHVCDALGLEGCVRLLGSLPPTAVREEYGRADVVIVPSVSEGFCVVALEAQAMMVPVVASDAEGLRESVAHQETGFIVPRRDPHAFAARLSELARSPELRQRMGEAGRRRAQTQFSVERQIERYEALYDLLLARSDA